MHNRGYFVDLGLIGYQEAWDLQRHLWSKRVEGEMPDTLLLLEHPHVITLGRRGNRSHLIASPEVLQAMSVPVFHVERGGDITYHGPGQLVVYPIFNLKEYGYRLIRFIDQLEEVVLRVLGDFGIDGSRNPLNRGVWAENDKIASIGVAIKRWVSFHGIALNYKTDLRYFNLINPCGLQSVKMTSMSKILGKEISRPLLMERMFYHFRELFPKDWQKKELRELITEEYAHTKFFHC